MNRRNGNLRFFETGNVYRYDKEKWNAEVPAKAYSEDQHLALWLTGKRVEGSWAHVDEDMSFYELKAYVQNIFVRTGVPAGMLVINKSDNNIFSKGLAYANRGGKVLAEVGILNGKLLKRFDISRPVYYADIDWKALAKLSGKREIEFLAGRWAAKEAFSKAWGTGIGKLRFQDLEILNDRQGAPYFSRSPFTGKVWISLSHAAGLVTASVILEENDES